MNVTIGFVRPPKGLVRMAYKQGIETTGVAKWYPNAPTTPEAVRKYRVARGFSVPKLARKIGCTPGYIYNIEAGRQEITAAFLEKLLRKRRRKVHPRAEPRLTL